MKSKKTKPQAAAASPKGKAKPKKLTLNKEMLKDLSAKDSEEVKGGAGVISHTYCCWVARAVYGEDNPRWLLFRAWLLGDAPGWFRDLYLRHGERFAGWLAPHTAIKAIIRRWMDSVIDRKRATVRQTFCLRAEADGG